MCLPPKVAGLNILTFNLVSKKYSIALAIKLFKAAFEAAYNIYLFLGELKELEPIIIKLIFLFIFLFKNIFNICQVGRIFNNKIFFVALAFKSNFPIKLIIISGLNTVIFFFNF